MCRRAADCVGDNRVCRREGTQTIVHRAVLSYFSRIANADKDSPPVHPKQRIPSY